MSAYDTSTGEPLPPELTSRVESELAQGERLVWVGQPLPGLYRMRTIPLVVMGVCFGGFSILWVACLVAMGLFGVEPEALGHPAARVLFGIEVSFLSLPGLGALACGIFLITSPLWGVWMARRTLYALTARRAIIFGRQLLGTVRVHSYTAAGLGAMSRVECGDGAGDLLFEEYTTRGANNSTTTKRRGFLAIANVHQVEELIRKTLLSPAQG
jgi:hypothetical protein